VGLMAWQPVLPSMAQGTIVNGAGHCLPGCWQVKAEHVATGRDWDYKLGVLQALESSPTHLFRKGMFLDVNKTSLLSTLIQMNLRRLIHDPPQQAQNSWDPR
jgi:hypothetical protein